MAKLKESPIGVLIGKLGQVVGAKWKGIAVLRIKSASVANPQTDKQKEQRMKFKMTMRFLQPMTQLLRIGWKNWAVGQTAFNAAMSYNVLNAIQGAYPNFTVDYPNALVSKGNLPPALNQAAASTVAGTVLFTWTNNSDEVGAATTDTTLLVVYNPGKNQAVFFAGLAERADGTQAVTVPHSFSGDLVHCYMGFQTVDGFDLSNSKYAGAITVA
jgi:hypothetical protein